MLEVLGAGWNTGGKVAIIGSALMFTWNAIAKHFTLDGFNHILITISTIIGLIYLVLKARGQILTNKEKRLEITQLERLEESRKAREQKNDGKEGK